MIGVTATEEMRGEAMVSLMSDRSARVTLWPATVTSSSDRLDVPRPVLCPALVAAEAVPDAAHRASAAVAAVATRRGRRVTGTPKRMRTGCSGVATKCEDRYGSCPWHMRAICL